MMRLLSEIIPLKPNLDKDVVTLVVEKTDSLVKDEKSQTLTVPVVAS